MDSYYRPPPPGPRPPGPRPPMAPPAPASTNAYPTTTYTGHEGFPQPSYGGSSSSSSSRMRWILIASVSLLVIAAVVVLVVLLTNKSGSSNPDDEGLRDCKCQNGGSCVTSDEGEVTCKCAKGYGGPLCATKTPTCGLTCQHGGTCVMRANTATCQCANGYSGRTCQTKLPDSGGDSECELDCQNGGQCSEDGSTCECARGWTGDLCDERASTECSLACVHGDCIREDESERCDCSNGFTGELCDQASGESCTVQCVNGGTCRVSNGVSSCTCPRGFSGTRCQTQVCQLVCANGGTCIISDGQSKCRCAAGYSGDTCTRRDAVSSTAQNVIPSSTAPIVGPAGNYALPPPSECSNQFSVQGCLKGNTSSTCGGVCSNDYGPTSRNACESGKPGVPVQFGCPRFLLFAPEMMQAAKDDGFEGKFHYAVVGHDPDTTQLDKGLADSCCQCYHLVFDSPRYLTNSKLTPPGPLLVQSFNTQASGAAGFDVFMGAGGLGVFNACSDKINAGNKNGAYMYNNYPALGQAFNGGVKPGPDSLKCSDAQNNLNDELIAAESCQTKVKSACNEITASSATVQEVTRNSCIESNQADHYYHENWKLWAKRVQCPTHLTEVTGCKPAAQSGITPPDPAIQTAAQAKAAGFLNTVGGSEPYHTTTMQDCCMPTCAWTQNVRVKTMDGYNTFYSCTADGTPITKKA